MRRAAVAATRAARGRPHRAWATRARKAFLAHDRDDLSQFGIVQGGTDHALRVESAERTVAVGFDGYAVGGLSVGEDRAEMLPALEAALGRCRPTAPATSWAWATRWGWSTRSR